MKNHQTQKNNSRDKNIIGLDWGSKRIGLARANLIARLPSPLDSIENTSDVIEKLIEIASENNAEIIVIGLPKNLKGEETSQTNTIRDFANRLREKTDLTIKLVDETLSTKAAEEYIIKHGLSEASLDSIAACFILEEFLTSGEIQ